MSHTFQKPSQKKDRYPQFIDYHNKSLCFPAKADAEGIAAAIADCFSIPSYEETPLVSHFNNGSGYAFSGNSTMRNTGKTTGYDPIINITITATGRSSRSPGDYQNAIGDWNANVFAKRIGQ